ncbi:MAG: dockerin type I repeat-containing protein [Magnetococcales bacterium]|nr:dockerin type I repeat-containing protein [Magnetococcales bacterium]
MKIIIQSSLILLLVMFCQSETARAGDVTSLNINDFYPMSMGNNWSYKVSDSVDGKTTTSTSISTVTGTEFVNGNNSTVLTYSDGGKTYLYSDSSGFYRTKESDSTYTATYSPPIKYANSQTVIGDTYSSTGTVNITLAGFGSAVFNYTSGVSIIGFESVAIAAGTFNAVKVQMSVNIWITTNGNTLSKTQIQDMWFVSGLGIIKHNINSTISLYGQSTMTSEVSELITSNLLPSHLLTVSTSGSGTVVSTPAGITCGSECTKFYNAGTPVTLTATPSVGYLFGGWQGDCSGSGTCSLTITTAKNATATFKLNTIKLDIDGNGQVDAADGVLILRALSGAPTIDTGLTMPAGMTSDKAIQTIRALGTLLDADGNGTVDATDGVLILRYLSGAPVIDIGLVLPTSQNNDSVMQTIKGMVGNGQ